MALEVFNDFREIGGEQIGEWPSDRQRCLGAAQILRRIGFRLRCRGSFAAALLFDISQYLGRLAVRSGFVANGHGPADGRWLAGGGRRPGGCFSFSAACWCTGKLLTGGWSL